MSNQTRLKALMVKHSLSRYDVAEMILISRAGVDAALISPSHKNYKRFTDKNLRHLRSELKIKQLEKSLAKCRLALKQLEA